MFYLHAKRVIYNIHDLYKNSHILKKAALIIGLFVYWFGMFSILHKFKTGHIISNLLQKLPNLPSINVDVMTKNCPNLKCSLIK